MTLSAEETITVPDSAEGLMESRMLLDAEETAAFADSVEGVLARHWESPLLAGAEDTTARLRALWESAAAQGWFDLAADDALQALIVVSGQLGRAACPLPAADVYVSAWLWDNDEWRASLGAAEIRPIIGTLEGNLLRYAEAAEAATHVVTLDSARGTLEVRAIASVTAVEGMARPRWSDVVVDSEPIFVANVSTERIEQAKTMLRLALIASAVEAAGQSHQLALEHAGIRSAFGKLIGSFQAVSHRLADCAIDVAASRALIEETVQSYGRADAAWVLASELAVGFGSKAAIRVQFGAAHTLAAMGYFEEHAAPWLFRRIHSDITRLQLFPLTVGSAADILIENGCSLPRLGLGESAEAFRAEVREFLAPYRDSAALDRENPAGPEITAAAVERGYITMGWPVEFGGRDAPVEEQVVLGEELAYNRVNLNAKNQSDMIGTTMYTHGSKEQQDHFLPMLAEGKLKAFLGYSEPDAGSDLASLRTKAVRDGDDWIINGSKTWGTRAHHAEYVWLATRTDPDAVPQHAGITMFLTKLDRPGFELQKHQALGGQVSCTTFYDNYRVSDADRVGEVNGGWKVLTTHLGKERVVLASDAALVLRLFDDMLAEIAEDVEGIAGPRGSARRARLGELASRIQAARVLVLVSVRATSTTGGGTRLEAPMAKVMTALLAEDFGEACLEIFGPMAALGGGIPGVPGAGAFEYNLRFSIMTAVGGGTIDIQRNLIARGLGLPR